MSERKKIEHLKKINGCVNNIYFAYNYKLFEYNRRINHKCHRRFSFVCEELDVSH